MDKNNGPGNKQPGIGVDAQGGAVIDPTANVIALNQASDRRQDDLRASFEKYVEAEIRHVEDMAKLSRSYEEKLGVAESKRIDAIRAVDVAAVATAAERSGQQAQVLATQVSASAETLRALVATQQAANAAAVSQMATQLTDRIALLERAQYESKGKEAVSDPMLSKLYDAVRLLNDSQQVSSGKGMAIEKVIALIAASGGGAGLLGYFLSH
jgi:hypothetical protein